MKIKCPNCDQRYDIELSMLGNHIKCETCGANFKIEDNIGHQWVSKRLYPCPDCNMNISRKAYSCPHCGAPLRPDEKKESKIQNVKTDEKRENKIQNVKIVRNFSVLNIIAFFICFCICFAAFLAHEGHTENVLQQIYRALDAICILLVGTMVATLFREG